MKEKVLVTGSAGFIGKNLVLELLRQKFEVRSFMQPAEAPSFFQSLENLLSPSNKKIASQFNSIEIATGDIRSLPDVHKAMKGCKWVFHLAAISHLWIQNEKDYHTVNVEGTRTVCQAALALRIDKLIHTSSGETIGRNPHNPFAFEDFILKKNECTGPYSRSKWLGEKIVADYAGQGHFAVTVNPSLPLGCGDDAPTPVGKMIKLFLNNPTPFYYSTGFNCVDVTELARGHIAAALKGRSGQRYILGGPNLPIEIFLQKIASFSGKKMPSQKIPYSLALTATSIMQIWSDWISLRAPISSVEGLKAVKKPFYFDCSKARNELGWSCESIDAALKAEINYYREHS